MASEVINCIIALASSGHVVHGDERTDPAATRNQHKLQSATAAEDNL